MASNLLEKLDMKWLWPFKRSQSLSKGRSIVQPVLVVETPDDGLKFLHEGPASKVDIVAVHGLGGHREKSWTNSNGVNWLQTILPKDLPNSRIMSWGYNASPGPDREQQSLQNISEKLVLDLYKLREMTKTQSQPIVFLAHSLGGSLVKSALIFSDLEQERPASNLDIISASTRGVFFIDTTELGISTHGMEVYLKSAEGSEQVNSTTYKEAQWLLDTLNQYISHSARHRNVYVTPRNGQEAIQKAETQDPSSSQFNSSYILINSDHNNINKFDSAEDDGYVKIREELFAILQETAWTDDTHIQWVE